MSCFVYLFAGCSEKPLEYYSEHWWSISTCLLFSRACILKRALNHSSFTILLRISNTNEIFQAHNSLHYSAVLLLPFLFFIKFFSNIDIICLCFTFRFPFFSRSKCHNRKWSWTHKNARCSITITVAIASTFEWLWMLAIFQQLHVLFGFFSGWLSSMNCVLLQKSLFLSIWRALLRYHQF